MLKMSCQNDNNMNNVGKTNVEKMINEENSEQQGKTNKVKIISKQEFKKLKAASFKQTTEKTLCPYCQLIFKDLFVNQYTYSIHYTYMIL